MKMNPLVSVIIPCYNAEKYVELAVRSVMNQTYKNIEILITDDCSTDSSYLILQRLAGEDSRIKLFRNEQNQKIVRTLNFMIEKATGDYIARMDADDVSLPKRIEKQIDFLEKNPDYGICGCNAKIINDKGYVVSRSLLASSNEDINKFKYYSCPFYHPTVCIRTSILKQNYYNSDFLYAEDYELWIRILSKNKGFNLPQKLFYYRVFDQQSSKVHEKRQKELSKKIFLESQFMGFDKDLILFLYGGDNCSDLRTKFTKRIKCTIKKSLTKNIYSSIVQFIVLFKIIKLRLFFISPFWFIRIGFICFLYFINVSLAGKKNG